MAAETFQSFWYGSELSSLERLCLTSFVDQGKDFELYTYDDSLHVPEGVVLRDATDIYPEDEVFTYQSGVGEGSVAVFADFFRYKLLYERGGWWVDTDVFYTGGSVPGGEVFVRQNESKIAIGVLRFPEKSSIMKRCLEMARSMGKSEASKEWGRTGPKLFSEVLEKEGRDDKALSKKYAYAVPWQDAEAIYLPREKKGIEEKLERAPFLHLWNNILGQIGIQKDIRPPERSYLDERARELNFTWPSQKVQYSPEAISQMAENWREARKARHFRHIRSTLTWKIVTYWFSLIRKIKSGLRV